MIQPASGNTRTFAFSSSFSRGPGILRETLLLAWVAQVHSTFLPILALLLPHANPHVNSFRVVELLPRSTYSNQGTGHAFI